MSDTAPISVDELANQIVDETFKPEPDTAKIVDSMRALGGLIRNEKDEEIRDQAFAVAEQHFIERHELEPLVKILRMKALWSGDRVTYGSECLAVLKECTKDRLAKAKIDCCGFGKKRPSEALDRLVFILALKPGLAVADKTWGYGTIRSEDSFYKTVLIDFDRKGGTQEHAMGFAYAADALKVIDASHILSVRHADPAAFDELCAKKPGDVVAMALRSYGPLTVAKLEDTLSGILPAGTEWKKFWSAARTQLAKNENVSLPPATKKTIPLVYSENAAEAAAATGSDRVLAALKACRDPKAILDQATVLVKNGVSDEARAVLADRLGFVLRAAVADAQFGNKTKIQTILLALSAGISEIQTRIAATVYTIPEEEFVFKDGTEDVIDLPRTLCMPSLILDAAKKLPAVKLTELVEKIPLDSDEAVARAFVDVVPEMSSNLVEHMAPKLMKGPAAEAFAAMVRANFALPRPSYPLLRWACHGQTLKELRPKILDIVTPFELLTTALVAIGQPDLGGEDLRMKNDVKKFFVGGVKEKGAPIETHEGAKWTIPLLEQVSDEERAGVFVRIQALDGVWEPLKKRNLVSTVLATWPELETHVPKAAEEPEMGFFEANTTSLRSYREREAAYRKLMDEELPQNRKDIEHAKSFGDLSENFEYESARNTERTLVARQAKYEEELKTIRGFDFSTVPAPGELVGMGSCVTVKNADGTEESFSILGEWDSDPALGIISCSTPLAKALLNCRAGTEVVLEIGDVRKTVTIERISTLPQSVLDWAK